MPVHTAATLDFWTQMQVLLVDGGFRLAAAIVILVSGWILATWVKRWLLSGLEHLPFDLTLKPLLASLARYAILIVTFVLVLEQFGVQTTSLIAVLGAAGLAVGLAMQGTLSNVAAGMMLLILRPFRVGHFVEIANQQGTVREIGLFTTILTTRNQVYVSIPNSSIFGAVITNFTYDATRRVYFTFTIDIVNDIGAVEVLVLEALNADTLTLKAPPPVTGVLALHEYGVQMYAGAYVRSRDYWQALPALQRDVKAALDKAGILWAVTRQASITRNEAPSPFNAAPDADNTPAQASPAEARPTRQ